MSFRLVAEEVALPPMGRAVDFPAKSGGVPRILDVVDIREELERHRAGGEEAYIPADGGFVRAFAFGGLRFSGNIVAPALTRGDRCA